MTYNGLKEILRKAFLLNVVGEIEDKARQLWLNPGTKEDIPENHLQSSWSRFLVFNYEKFGFNYISGKIDCCGVHFVFKKEGYDRLNVDVFVDHRTSLLYNSCLLKPHYTEDDFKGRKSISQLSHIIRNDKDFDRYLKNINKRFNLN